MSLILASGSPRRRELMAMAGFDFTVITSDCDESLPAGIAPEEAVLTLSRRKAEAVRLAHPELKSTDVIVAADTVVAFDDTILGKPADRNDAKRLLRLLSGRTHQVYTGVCVDRDGEKTCFASRSDVTFYALTDEEIDAYVATGECDDKAGAYGIQEKGGLLAERIEGDWYNIVGLPIARLARLLRETV